MGWRDLFKRGPSEADRMLALAALDRHLAHEKGLAQQALASPAIQANGVAPGKRQVSPQEAYSQHVWTYVMATRVATALATTRLKGMGPGGEEWPLSRLNNLGTFERPNPETSIYEHVFTLGVDAMTVGENWESIEPDGVWRLEPARVTIVPDKSGRAAKYRYTGEAGVKVDLDPAKVIRRRLPNPIDPWRGLGPGGVGIEDVKLEREMDAYQQGFFDRGIRPSGVLSTDQDIGSDNAREIGRSFMSQHGGTDGRWGVPVLWSGMKLSESGESHRDMEYTEGRKTLRDRHAALYGVPPFLAGDTDSVAYANSVAQMQVFVRFTVLPIARWMAQGWNNSKILMPVQGTRVEFDEKELYDAMIDMAVQATAAATLYDSGLYGRDKVRWKFYRDPPMDETEAADVKATPAPSPFGGPGLGMFPSIRMNRDAYLERMRARAEERERKASHG